MTMARELISYHTQSFTGNNGGAMNLGIVTFLNPITGGASGNFEWETPIAEHRFNPEFLDQFSDVLTLAETDASLTGLIVTGEGKYFSNGVDIGYIKTRPDLAFKVQKQVEILMARILTLNMLTVCVMNGHTTAAGALLSLAFDYRFMGERGYFFLPAVDLGIVYSHGMVELVKAKVLDPGIHRDLMIMSKRFTILDLLRLGIVDKGPIANLQEAIDFVKLHAKKNKASLGEIKNRMYHSVVSELTGERISDMHWDAVLRARL